MPRIGRKTKDMRHVSFRMPPDVYEDYVAVATLRGVDLSAVLNWVVAEYRPLLLLRRAEYEAGMLLAATASLPREAVVGPGPQEALTRLTDLIGNLQDVASKLEKVVGGKERRQAG